MRQLYSFIASRVSQKAKIEAPLRPQGRVDTSPVAVHSRFLRQINSFDQKRPPGGHVDIFPPYNIRAADVHQQPVAQKPTRPQHLSPRWPPAASHIGGSPFAVHLIRFVSQATMLFGGWQTVLCGLRSSMMPLRRQSSQCSQSLQPVCGV